MLQPSTPLSSFSLSSTSPFFHLSSVLPVLAPHCCLPTHINCCVDVYVPVTNCVWWETQIIWAGGGPRVCGSKRVSLPVMASLGLRDKVREWPFAPHFRRPCLDLLSPQSQLTEINASPWHLKYLDMNIDCHYRTNMYPSAKEYVFNGCVFWGKKEF